MVWHQGWHWQGPLTPMVPGIGIVEGYWKLEPITVLFSTLGATTKDGGIGQRRSVRSLLPNDHSHTKYKMG